MIMESTGSDQSPPLSEATPGSWNGQAGSWMGQAWDSDELSEAGQLIGTCIGRQSRELSELVEDKDIAARAVAFVINSTRKGIVPLCADVATLLRNKKQLEHDVTSLKSENEILRNSRSASLHTSHSTSPPPSFNSYSDNKERSRPCSRCSSLSSSLVSSSPKLDKTNQQRSPPGGQRSPTHHQRSLSDHLTSPNNHQRSPPGGHHKSPTSHQRSPRLHRTSAFTLHDSNRESDVINPAAGLRHSASSSKVRTDVMVHSSPLERRHSQRGRHSRKNSLPEMVSEPQGANLTKVNPRSNRVSIEIQCDLDPARSDTKLESQLHQTQQMNTKLATDLGAARKEVDMLRARLKELEMNQLARQCMERFHIENECPGLSSASSLGHPSSYDPTPGASPPTLHPAHITPPHSPTVLPTIQLQLDTTTGCCTQGPHSLQGSSSLQTSPLLAAQMSPVLVTGPLEGCRCVSCLEALGGSSDTQGVPLATAPRIKNSFFKERQSSVSLDIELSDHVVIKGERTGHIRYIGHMDEVGQTNAVFAGIELDAPVGMHDGSINGKRYFRCAADQGIFVPVQDIVCVINKQRSEDPDDGTQRFVIHPPSRSPITITATSRIRTSRPKLSRSISDPEGELV